MACCCNQEDGKAIVMAEGDDPAPRPAAPPTKRTSVAPHKKHPKKRQRGDKKASAKINK